MAFRICGDSMRATLSRDWTSKHRRFRSLGRNATSENDACPYTTLGIRKGASRSEIRAAYIRKIKTLHPDVNSEDTTEKAASINLAYEQICSRQSITENGTIEHLCQNWIFIEGWNTKDVFDRTQGEAEIVFVNPFACQNFNPLEWKALQALVQNCPPEKTLTENGISFSGFAIHYLTREQMDVIEIEMEQMFRTLDFGFCEWVLADYLARAQTNKGL